VKSRAEVLQTADIILSINPICDADIAACKAQVLLGFFQALFNSDLIKNWAAKGKTVFSIDMLPRTTRAQSMDVLSSQANIAGYKAVLLAANIYPKYFPMFMIFIQNIFPCL